MIVAVTVEDKGVGLNTGLGRLTLNSMPLLNVPLKKELFVASLDPSPNRSEGQSGRLGGFLHFLREGNPHHLTLYI